MFQIAAPIVIFALLHQRLNNDTLINCACNESSREKNLIYHGIKPDNFLIGLPGSKVANVYYVLCGVFWHGQAIPGCQNEARTRRIMASYQATQVARMQYHIPKRTSSNISSDYLQTSTIKEFGCKCKISQPQPQIHGSRLKASDWCTVDKSWRIRYISRGVLSRKLPASIPLSQSRLCSSCLPNRSQLHISQLELGTVWSNPPHMHIRCSGPYPRFLPRIQTSHSSRNSSASRPTND